MTADLRDGLSALPIWMRFFLRDLIAAQNWFTNPDVTVATAKDATR
jgi:hypothetical protein